MIDLITLWGTKETIIVVSISVVLLLLIAVAITLLQIFVFSRNSIKKQLRDCERKYSYLDALLIGQDSQYIRRLEMISRTNLLYVDKYNEFSKRYKEIFDGDDKYTESMLKQARTLISKKQFNNIKAVLAETKKAVAAFESKTNDLDNDLYTLIKPEEEARSAILSLKENYRRVKQIYYANSNEIEIASATFSKVFEKIEKSFSSFDSHLECAEYDDATSLLPIIGKVITALENTLAVLPNLCILTLDVIPGKINELTTRFAQCESEAIPLFNIGYKKHLEEWNKILDDIKESISLLKINGINETLETLQNDISTVSTQLDKELQDRETFNSEITGLYDQCVGIENYYLKICSLLPELERIYIIPSEEKEKIAKLKTDMTNLGDSRRNLDNYIHSSTKQPFSILKTKLDELRGYYQLASIDLANFKGYVDLLKSSTEDAYQMVFVYYYRCKQIEASLRELNLPDFVARYEGQIENVYSLLNQIDATLKQKPIDVSLINQNVEALKITANAFFDEAENKQREIQLAESAIVYANRDRNFQADVHQQLTALEKDFMNGEFVKVYHDASAIYKHSHIEENK